VGGVYLVDGLNPYNADPIQGANGDMGENNTASFDPIFYFHHCFIDYVFWKWQQKHGVTKAGSITVEANPEDKGTISTGLPDQKEGMPLDMNTPLQPFKKADGSDYVSGDLVDIENQLGYTYGPGSVDAWIAKDRARPMLMAHRRPVQSLKAGNISRKDVPGSFVIRTFAKAKGSGDDGRMIEVGREAILSRWRIEDCGNCQTKLGASSVVSVHQDVVDILQGADKDSELEYVVRVENRKGIISSSTDEEGPARPTLKYL
jgi:tyrosinase